ncbi:hypothetical protein CU254_28750 [Amycolatopsis sp. AA4]|nr:hypothetical protein CU254_28750 [Amycolatopsis sp. AA4]
MTLGTVSHEIQTDSRALRDGGSGGAHRSPRGGRGGERGGAGARGAGQALVLRVHRGGGRGGLQVRDRRVHPAAGRVSGRAVVRSFREGSEQLAGDDPGLHARGTSDRRPGRGRRCGRADGHHDGGPDYRGVDSESYWRNGHARHVAEPRRSCQHDRQPSPLARQHFLLLCGQGHVVGQNWVQDNADGHQSELQGWSGRHPGHR